MNCPKCGKPIDEHEAGRQTDACVAEVMMGFSQPLGNAWLDSRSYSRKIDGAWEIIEEVKCWLFSRRRRFFRELTKSIQMSAGQPVAWPDAIMFLMPIHICRAALKARTEE
jgi:hypothetical protein